ncbi:cache domain-containing protein [Sphaerisporangium perillae]|uniref:cache domain-containing protein n=1 Tax=Sphaerisporangium perillae TaxID=2935860 RepID=UPI00200EE077|nr:cache domain-containing protein [Sphaerisporangium perillae]
MATKVEDEAGATVTRACRAVSDTAEQVFRALRELRVAAAEQVRLVRRAGREPATADLAALRPMLFGHLGALIAGIGFIAAPGLLSDAPWYLEWWQDGPSGAPVQLLRDLNPASSAFYDYTHWDWFAGPHSGAERTVCGPYVDYLCTDEYSLTLSVPVLVEGAFIGVAAADVLVRSFEGAVIPSLRRIPAPALLVNASGRVVASTTSRWLAGSVYRGAAGFTAHPCGDLPLRLVAAELPHAS